MNNFALYIQEQPFKDFLENQIFKIFYNIHRKTPVLESLLNKVADLKVHNFIEKRLENRYFPVNIEKFLRTTFL